MPFTQEIIHMLEQGKGLRYVKIGLAILGVILFTGAYNWHAFKNMSTLEAMDAAQLARNLADGKGYKTQFVRPVSMYLVARANERAGRMVQTDGVSDMAEIRRMHPDISNPPVYPVLLAGLLKVLPGDFKASNKPPFRYPPELAIGVLNQLLFLLLIGAVFLLAKKLFDPAVAWLSAIILFGTDLFWRFASSGLSTILLMLIFVALLWGLFLLEREGREPKWGQRALFGLAALCGVVVGVGCLTRYSFGWLILPVVLYVAIFSGPRRMALASVILVSFIVVIAPWVARNIWVSGLPFGTASYSIFEGTFNWPAHKLSRSLSPRFEVPSGMSALSPYWNKFFANLKLTFTTDAFRFTGSWLSAFFAAGMLMNFRSPSLQRLRYFLLFCVPMVLLVQIMGRTQLSEDSPEINSENLLVLLAPIVIVYGVGFMLILIEQLELPLVYLKYVVMGGVALVASIPLLLVFLPPNQNLSGYPPYHPSIIQQIAGWMKEDDLIMTDVPWAVAWYGNRQAVWLTRHLKPPPEEATSPDTFFAINDVQKPIRALYLTPRMTDGRFLTEWLQNERSWANLMVDVIVNQIVPPWCPLRAAPTGFLPTQIFLADWERWRKSPEPVVVPATPATPATPSP